jgi:hypothetical protein
MPAPKKEDYRVTRGKALIAEKKRAAANPNKKVVLPSKENAKRVAGLALAVAGPGKVVKGAQLAAKAVKAGSEGRAVARGLKAANKPTNKVGTKSDRSDRRVFQGQANFIKNADPARPNRVRGGSMASMKEFGGVGNVAKASGKTPKQIEFQKQLSKELNPVRKKK